jgi:hypothetical protein
MREHLQTTGYIQSTSSPAHALDSRSSLDSEDDSSYSATFRELFCVTAQEIARSLDTNLHNMGTLFEDVLTTGTLLNRMIYYNSPAGRKAILAAEVATTTKDLEAGHTSPILFGKGQLLVLTRRVDTNEANRLEVFRSRVMISKTSSAAWTLSANESPLSRAREPTSHLS